MLVVALKALINFMHLKALINFMHLKALIIVDDSCIF